MWLCRSDRDMMKQSFLDNVPVKFLSRFSTWLTETHSASIPDKHGRGYRGVKEAKQNPNGHD